MPKPAATAPRHKTRTRRFSSAAGYMFLGFVLGAIFWHFVGFWDFLGQVMLRGPSQGGEVAVVPSPIKLRDRISGSSALAVVLQPAACTTLQLDRSSGTTSKVECETQALALRSLKTARREDRWVSAEQRIQQVTARRWSVVTVETGPKAQEQVGWD